MNRYGEEHVLSVSMVLPEDHYMVELVFPGTLATNYGICLPAVREMKAAAGIVIGELRLTERFFQPLRKL